MSPQVPSPRTQALVAAAQWGLIQLFVVDTVGRLLRNYYRVTTGAVLPPSWVSSLHFAAPLGLVIGGIGGYQWVTSGQASTAAAAHRTRLRFVAALVVGWTIAIVPTFGVLWLLGEGVFSVPYVVVPTLVAGSVFGGAYLFAYRMESG